MNPEIKRRWVEALRSGRYEQGYGKLSQNGKFCCLGVLCEIAVQDGIIGVRDINDDTLFYGNNHEGSATVLPHTVREWAGLGERGVLIPSKQRSLVEINDHRTPFSRIADIIEEEL